MSSPLRESLTAVFMVVVASVGIGALYTLGQSRLMAGAHRVEHTIAIPLPKAPSAETPKRVKTLLTASEFQTTLKQSCADHNHTHIASRLGLADDKFAEVEASPKNPAELVVHLHVLGYSAQRMNWARLSMEREVDNVRVSELNDDLLAVVEADVKSLVSSTAQ